MGGGWVGFGRVGEAGLVSLREEGTEQQQLQLWMAMEERREGKRWGQPSLAAAHAPKPPRPPPLLNKKRRTARRRAA